MCDIQSVVFDTRYGWTKAKIKKWLCKKKTSSNSK